MALVLVLLFIAVGLLYTLISTSATVHYMDELNQRLNRDLARNLVADRNLVAEGDGPAFHILVSGVLAFQVSSAGDATLEECYFDFDTVAEPGQFVDFILGNGGRGDAVGDESVLRAIVRARHDE